GYLAQVFPHLTMTFVYREVLALRAAGLEVKTFSTWTPAPNELSAEAKPLVGDTFYIFPLNWPQFLLSHIRYLLARPQRYLGTLLFCLSREHKTLKNRWRTLSHFCQAVYLAQAVERSGIDHLHVHFALNATTLALVVARLTGIPFSFTAHANDIFANPILLPEKIKEARFIVAISEYNIRFMYNIVPAQETLDKSYLVHCGIDVQKFAPPDQRPAQVQPTILAVGRLVEKKGYPYLIKACKILAERGYDFRCLILGGGPHEARLKEMVQAYNLGERVLLKGIVFQEHLGDYLKQADIFVLPCIVGSDQDMDGIPNTLMEAMSMEIPTISTNISGIPELIEDGKTGLLVPPEDEIALAEAIISLLENAELRHALGQAGRSKVVEEFEIEKNAHRLLRIFKSRLNNESVHDYYPSSMRQTADV
ncbi:MAG TPA: glycosyltransferase, partial [Anaerolineae bacterium]|nr:glycosyltransferase [Anaerolineae bacterium]